MSLVDKEYFEVRLIQVPNLQVAAREEKLNEYIVEYEDSYLDTMLGVKLKNEFLTAITGTPDQKWIDLRDGKEYDVSGVTYRWQGFVNDKKLSPIANYVYSKYATDNQFKMNDIGETKAKAENSNVVAPHYRTAKVWNEMVKLNFDLINFLNEFSDDYPSWNFCYNTPLLIKDNVIGL